MADVVNTPTTIVVTNFDQFATALRDANAGEVWDSAAQQIVHTNNIVIDVEGNLDAATTLYFKDLPAINNAGLNLTIEGNGALLNGRVSMGGFSVFSGNVTIK